MKKLIFFWAMLSIMVTASAQNTYKAVIKDAKKKTTLPGATLKVQGTVIGATADSTGLVILTNLPPGKAILQFSYLGYKTRTDTLVFSFGAGRSNGYSASNGRRG
jgi:outer membrane receptor for ferrienterochelin and colicins